MLKKSILLLLLVVASSYVNAQDKWFMVKVSDKVSVNFPLEPKKLNENSHGIKDADGVVYVLTVIDLLKVTNMDAPTFSTEVKKQTFADEFMEGFKPSFPKYVFKAAQIINIKGHTAYRIVGRNEADKLTVTMSVVFVDGVAHNLSSIVPDGKSRANADKYIAGEIYFK